MEEFRIIIKNVFDTIHGIIKTLNSNGEIPTTKCVRVIGEQIDIIDSAICERDKALIKRIEAVKDLYVRNYQANNNEENMDTIRVCNDLIELIRSDYNG